MKKLIHISQITLRLIVVLLTLVAMIAGGASSAQRIYDGYGPEKIAETELPDTPMLLPGPPEPEELPGNMDDSGRANSEPSAYLTSVSLVKIINPSFRFHPQEKETRYASLLSGSQNQIHRATSLAKVTTRLGHQFTLVGLKPSGTM